MATVNGLLGRKVGMTQIFTPEGAAVPVTVIECGPCSVVQRKTTEKDGYEAVQLGYIEKKAARKETKIPRGHTGHRGKGEASKPVVGHFEKNGGANPTRILAEFKLIADGEEPAAGAALTVADIFAAGDAVQVQGKSKGRGFSGVIKRHNFKGQGASHGSKIHRKPASNGATDPARTFPGVRRPGRFGNENITQLGLKVVEIDAERNLLLVKGAVPGAPGGVLRITKSK
ncbi:large subunit ribosomal protein L3 [Abditibacterium utsteinense]|uniref:Large ribosomal subunit protein uL3 n=1 Tax=Abditibacterium utsteinense TaxID=1960156 RepID=A0A2S8ST04_9BACT|nr:50S ribosomal protein L3 [Abditibacterium utsteinense]PQV63942.1 large subunit ribosomal protein L3 [Abditibacterium utsteinense]